MLGRRSLCATTLATTLVALAIGGAAPARADEASLSPGDAAWLSLGVTAGAYVLGGAVIGIDTQSTAALVTGEAVAGLALIVGPSFGRAIGGDWSGARDRILVRAAIVGVSTGLIVAMASQNHEDLDVWMLGSLGVLTVGAGALLVHGAVDILHTPRDLEALRGPSLALAPTAIGPARAPGLVLVGRF
jgi:hypothetical protein